MIFTNPSYAACDRPSYCDALPGECATTANGGHTIIIGSFQVIERKCSDPVMKNCPSCGPDDGPYCEDGNGHCGPVDECKYPDGSPKPDDTDVTTNCVDTIWESCCTPGTPAGTCGDGTCGGTESCTNCVSDCGTCLTCWCGDGSCNCGESSQSCAADCGTAMFCGDNSCNNGENCSSCAADCGACPTPPPTGSPEWCGDGSCNNGEWCGTCPSDCGSCTSCGDGSCNNGENCGTCSTDCGACLSCGDGSCNGNENCSNCATDCGSCAGSFCGDTTCDAGETCATCSSDCGSCSSNEAWFQISAGHVGSANSGGASVALQSEIPDLAECTGSCVRSVTMEDLDSTDLTDGFTVVGSGTIDVNGGYSERAENTYATDTTKTRYNERYEFFYRNSGLGGSPSNTFTGSESDIQKPTYNPSNISYFQSGDVTLQSPWSVASGETYVIFIDGNLNLADGDGLSDQLIDVAPGGYLAFIVSGDITVDSNLGNTSLTDTTSNVEGVFIANGQFTINSKGAAAGGDDRFIGEGTFVGWSGVNLNRDFSDGGARSVENLDKPVELFVYRPDFVTNMPESLLVPVRIWQETN